MQNLQPLPDVPLTSLNVINIEPYKHQWINKPYFLKTIQKKMINARRGLREKIWMQDFPTQLDDRSGVKIMESHSQVYVPSRKKLPPRGKNCNLQEIITMKKENVGWKSLELSIKSRKPA